MNRNLELRSQTDFVRFSLFISYNLLIYENSRILLPFIATLITLSLSQGAVCAIVGQYVNHRPIGHFNNGPWDDGACSCNKYDRYRTAEGNKNNKTDCAYFTSRKSGTIVRSRAIFEILKILYYLEKQCERKDEQGVVEMNNGRE